jgi:hypothetical protein
MLNEESTVQEPPNLVTWHALAKQRGWSGRLWMMHDIVFEYLVASGITFSTVTVTALMSQITV